jgi:hypothetical protein
MPFLPVDADGLDAIHSSRWFEAPILAAGGYEIALGRSQFVTRWVAGTERLMQRDPFPTDRQSFFFRPLELLGLALGSEAVRQQDSSRSRWIEDVVKRGEHLLGDDAWTALVMARVRLAIGESPNWQVKTAPATSMDLATLLWATAALPDVPWLRADLADAEREFIRHVSVGELVIDNAARAGIAWISLRIAVAHVVDATIASITIGDVVQGISGICRRFPLFVQELRSRHSNRPALEVADEYDVQDILRAVLTLHFDDVRPEEWTPSYGGIHSRMDFLLKPERVVIETKMTRRGLGQREVVEQLTIDKDHYRVHPDCDRLVCFVYDPDRYLTNPVALERDLSTDSPLPTQVIVAPRGI